MRRLPPLLLAAALLASGLLGGLAALPAEGAPTVRVTVLCTPNPEINRVKNNPNNTITVQRIGSLYQPRAAEPYAVNRSLGAGATIAFQSGTNASANKLTGQFIYSNDVGSTERARVKTSIGTFIDRCG